MKVLIEKEKRLQRKRVVIIWKGWSNEFGFKVGNLCDFSIP